MKAPPLKLGELTVSPPVLLAPMAGLTDAAMRRTSLAFGAGLAFTEVVNAEALVRGSRRTAFLLETLEGESPVAAHFYGRDPEVMARAAELAWRTGRFAVIDVNCGCPVRKIVAKGCGAALMADPERIGAIVRAMRGATPLPVTVKTRIGWSADRWHVLEVAREAEAGGAAAIIVHGRYAVDHHGGPADWDAIAAVKRGVGIPVVGNGGVLCAGDVEAMFLRTGVDGVMVGRGAIGNPWIFAEACATLGYPPPAGVTGIEESRRATLDAHFARLVELKTREQAFRKRCVLPPADAAALVFRPHLLKYMRGTPLIGELRRRLDGMRSEAALLDALKGIA
jgi:tRNA-dihydrouridine synthase B